MTTPTQSTRPTDAALAAKFPGFIPLSDKAAVFAVLNAAPLVKLALDNAGRKVKVQP